jgi:hypothetical protein
MEIKRGFVVLGKGNKRKYVDSLRRFEREKQILLNVLVDVSWKELEFETEI